MIAEVGVLGDPQTRQAARVPCSARTTRSSTAPPALELHPDDVPRGSRVLVIDDVLATGGTAAAACRLLQRAGGRIAGVAVAVELTALGGRSALAGIPVTALRQY